MENKLSSFDKSNIAVIVMDVDGTLTDGTINIGDNGEVFKAFYCRDGLGIKMVQKRGIRVVILTSRMSELVLFRAKELGIEDVIQNAVDDKYTLLKEYMKEHELSPEQVAYIGDDINDLEAMSLCGLVGCPSDAVDKVKKIADYISCHFGGKGAVREFVDWIISEQ